MIIWQHVLHASFEGGSQLILWKQSVGGRGPDQSFPRVSEVGVKEDWCPNWSLKDSCTTAVESSGKIDGLRKIGITSIWRSTGFPAGAASL